jgi:hypothetical protein
MLKGCATLGDERRQTHEILHRLRAMFGEDHLKLTILVAEQNLRQAASAPESSVEDYLAEIVFRLYQKPLPLGRRLRILEIVKSQGVNMLPGEHTWQIVTGSNYEKLFPYKALADHIASKYGFATTSRVRFLAFRTTRVSTLSMVTSFSTTRGRCANLPARG